MTRADEPRRDPSLLPLVYGPSPTLASVDREPGPAAPDPIAPSTDAAGVPSILPLVTPNAAAKPHPRLAEVSQAVDTGDWPAVTRALGAPGDAGDLPPALGLVLAVALKEAQVPVSEALRERADPSRVAIRAMAALLALPESSPLAVVLAKRLLRSNPVSWRERQAPPIGTSLVIVLLGVAAGLAFGYAVSAGYVELHLPGLR